MTVNSIQFSDLLKTVKKVMKYRGTIDFDSEREPVRVAGVRAVKNFSSLKIAELHKDRDMREEVMSAISECDMTSRDVKSLLTLAVSLNAMPPGTYVVNFQ